jgi:hypothetical protein
MVVLYGSDGTKEASLASMFSGITTESQEGVGLVTKDILL